MSVTEHGPAQGPEQHGIADLLQRCERTRDRAERAALLSRVAVELDRAAEEIGTEDTGTKQRDRADGETVATEVIATLRGQASMARFVADLERQDRAHQAGASQYGQ